jgi:hypothetical protein
LQDEELQDKPNLWFIIKDAEGEVIRRISAPDTKGFNRITWDLTYPATDAINSLNDLNRNYTGSMVAPGKYNATLFRQVDGEVTQLNGPVEFEVIRMYEGALPAADPSVVAEYWRETEKLSKSTTALRSVLNKAVDRVKMLEKTLTRTTTVPGELDKMAHDLKQRMLRIELQISGNSAKDKVGEKNNPTLFSRAGFAGRGMNRSTYGPTTSQKRNLEIAVEMFQKLKAELEQVVNIEIPKFEEELKKVDAPWIEGQPIPDYK